MRVFTKTTKRMRFARACGGRSACAMERLESRLLFNSYAVTNLNDSGPGSLRDAVQQANAHAGDDTVTFGALPGDAITLTSGPLEISDTRGLTSITGPGAGFLFLVANNGDRALTVDAGASASVSGLTFSAPLDTSVHAGGIVNLGTLTLTQCTAGGRAAGNGGGILNHGTLSVVDCELKSSAADGAGGAIYNDGGAVRVFDTDLSSNTAHTGSAVFSAGGTVNFRYDTFTKNHSTTGPGGAVAGTGNLTVTQCTFYRDALDQGKGSALYSGGTLTVTNTTINGDDVFIDPQSSGDATFYNSIADGISGGALDQKLAAGQAPSSNNLIGLLGSDGLIDGQNGNRIGINPMLASALGFYGGRVQTLVPLPGSPAIDHGNNALALDYSASPPVPLATDQRGLSRVSNGTVDIGATETQPLVVNTTDSGLVRGELTFVEAISLADASRGAFGSVTFAPTVFAPDSLHTIAILGAAGIVGNVTIQGPGPNVVALTLTGADPLFDVPSAATLTVSGVAVTGSKAPAFLNQGNASIDDCLFSGDMSIQGGAIYNAGMITVSNSTFSGNSLVKSGGLGGGAFANLPRATAFITHCTFVNNSAGTRAGGAIYNQGTMTVADSTFAGNTAGLDGGAIQNAPTNPRPTLTVTNCTISGNSAASGDGGLAAFGFVTLNNSIVAGNFITGTHTASDLGGGTGSNNLIGTGGSAGLVDGQNGNLVGVADAKLGPLADNGGPTMTMALLPGSPAIDAGSNALAIGADGKPLLTDQRGFNRLLNGTVDIGAFESGSSPYRLPGDANHDGKVDFSDLLILAQDYGRLTQPPLRADFNHDGTVDFADLLILAQHYGTSLTAADSGATLAPMLLKHRTRSRP